MDALSSGRVRDSVQPCDGLRHACQSSRHPVVLDMRMIHTVFALLGLGPCVGRRLRPQNPSITMPLILPYVVPSTTSSARQLHVRSVGRSRSRCQAQGLENEAVIVSFSRLDLSNRSGSHDASVSQIPSTFQSLHKQARFPRLKDIQVQLGLLSKFSVDMTSGYPRANML